MGIWFADNRPVSIMMIDIDHFKLYNDALGHPAGDDCLRQVAAVFLAAASGTDTICARFGGEEFTIAMREASEMEAARLARALVQAVESLAIPHPSRADGLSVITISTGIAFKPEGTSADAAGTFAAADQALQRKAAGTALSSSIQPKSQRRSHFDRAGRKSSSASMAALSPG